MDNIPTSGQFRWRGPMAVVENGPYKGSSMSYNWHSRELPTQTGLRRTWKYSGNSNIVYLEDCKPISAINVSISLSYDEQLTVWAENVESVFDLILPYG